MDEETIVSKLYEELFDENRFDELFDIHCKGEAEPGHSEHYEHFGNRGFVFYQPCFGGDALVTIDLSPIRVGMPLYDLVEGWDLMEGVRNYSLLFKHLEVAAREAAPGGVSVRRLYWDFQKPKLDEDNRKISVLVEFSANIEEEPYSGFIGEYD